MRNRHEQLNIRLNESEMALLDRYSARSGLSKSAYIRMLVNGYTPKETPPKEYNELIRLMSEVYSELRNQNSDAAAIQLQKAMLLLQAEVTLPERRE